VHKVPNWDVVLPPRMDRDVFALMAHAGLLPTLVDSRQKKLRKAKLSYIHKELAPAHIKEDIKAVGKLVDQLKDVII